MSARTLNFYLGRRFLVWVFVTSVVFLALATLGDTFEMNKLATRAGLSGLDALYFTSLRLPLLYLDLLPFVFLFSTVICLLRLSEARELVVIRAAGISVWQFLVPFVLGALVIGALMVAFLEPYGTSALAKYRQIENQITQRNVEASLLGDGIWLREQHPQANFILRAEKIVDLAAHEYGDLTLHVYDAEGAFESRIEAASGRLTDGQWHLQTVTLHTRGQAAQAQADLFLPSQLDPSKLMQQFNPPDTINIWQLGDYIESAKTAGSDVARHQVRLHALISLPIMLLSMVLVAACFSLPTGRLMSTGRTIGLAVLCGFLVYIGDDFVTRLGTQSVLPPVLASWAAPLIAGLLAIRYLLGAEDG